jgi:hypothetical protein
VTQRTELAKLHAKLSEQRTELKELRLQNESLRNQLAAAWAETSKLKAANASVWERYQRLREKRVQEACEQLLRDNFDTLSLLVTAYLDANATTFLPHLEAFCRLRGVTPQAAVAWLRASGKFHVEHVQRLAKALGCEEEVACSS